MIEEKPVVTDDFPEVEKQPEIMERQSSHRLETILSSLERGWKIVIMRVQPSWCRGHLETIEHYGEDDEPIDVDYVVRMWGGRKIQLKIHNERGQWVGGGSISLFSYPPKVRGKVLTEQDVLGSSIGPNATITPAYQPQPQQGLDINQVIGMLSKQKGGGLDVPAMLQLLEYSKQSQGPAPMQQQQNGMEQMLQMAQTFKQMRDIFGGDLGGGGGGGGGGGDDSGFSGIAAEVIKGLMTKQQPPAVPPRGALSPPRRQLPQPQAQPIQPPVSNAQPLAPQTPQKPAVDPKEIETVTQLALKISSLDADDAAGVVLLAMDGMTEGKRAAAMQAFMSAMNGSDDEPLDDSDVLDDNHYQDETP